MDDENIVIQSELAFKQLLPSRCTHFDTEQLNSTQGSSQTEVDLLGNDIHNK